MGKLLESRLRISLVILGLLLIYAGVVLFDSFAPMISAVLFVFSFLSTGRRKLVIIGGLLLALHLTVQFVVRDRFVIEESPFEGLVEYAGPVLLIIAVGHLVWSDKKSGRRWKKTEQGEQAVPPKSNRAGG